jgi:uncharacterized delta-60 repeat protein
LIIGGFFASYNGIARKYIARLNTDGTLDATFAPTGTGLNSYVRTLTLQPDGKVLVGGDFTSYDGIQRGHLARLNSDGTLDTTFLQSGSGFNDLVRAIAVQPDGKIIVVGAYNSFNGTNRSRVARLNVDGSLDTNFLQSGSGTDGTVGAVALQPDGKIVIGGLFFEYTSIPRRFIARLNTDGTLDNTFTQTGTGLNGTVLSIAVQRDGKLAIAGGFRSYNGTSREFLARLNSDGTLDSSFGQTGTGLDGVVVTLALQPDEKVIVSGFLTSYNGTPRKYIARFNTDGTLDATFNQTGTGLSDYVQAMAIQPDGKIVVTGPFSSYNGTGRLFVARLYGDIFVNFLAGDASDKTIQFPIIDDSVPESNETLTLSLNPVAGGATTTAPSSATLTILDNDISSTSAVSGSGVFGGTATLSATLTGASGSSLSGKTIAFTLNNTAVGTAVTNSSGVATLSGVSLSGIIAGTQANAVRASFAGDANFSGSSNTGPLTVSKAAATVTLGNLTQPYDGTAKTVSTTTNPAGLSVTFTYNGSATPPTNIGSYTVVGTISNANYQGSATATLTIVCPTVVTNGNDSGPGSLRNVIASACDGSTITFDMTQVTSPINLTSGELAINKNLTITGPGANLLTVRRSTANGTPNFRIFKINQNMTVTISGMTISNGRAADGVSAPVFGGPGEAGGGILNAGGVLTLNNLVITGNRTGNGAVPSSSSDVGTSYGGLGGLGGGISSSGTLTMTNVVVSNNVTGSGAVSYYGGGGGHGGGVHISSGTLTMTSCSVIGNVTTRGAIGTTGGASSGSGGYGGGLYLDRGTAKITGSKFSDNITGGSEVSTPNNSGSGGGGGGIYIGFGTISLINSTISGNHTGDGIGFAGQGGFGGGILSSGTLTIISSTISGNVTGLNGSNGGGVGGGVVNDGTLEMINSTVSGNSTTGNGGTGGGIWNSGSLTLKSCTIAFNSAFASFGGAGIHHFNSSSVVNISNTIVTNNTLSGSPTGPDVTGPYNSQGFNLIGNGGNSSGFNQPGDQVGSSAAPLNSLLGPLANYGGLTQTHLLLPGSPAINAGSSALLPTDAFDLDNDGDTAEALPVDQRGVGFARGVNNAVDIGAVEVNYTISATGGTPKAPRSTALSAPSCKPPSPSPLLIRAACL